jgi:acyl-CoA synthetase (AMP-forming)/AMP-acid ligase II
LNNGQKGEICSKNPSTFHGYLNEPEKSDEVFDGEWFKSGDIGYFDDDGYLYIVDRMKEVMKNGGFKVMPSELEMIIDSIDGVVSSCVVGVLESSTSNDIIHAFVIVDGSKGLTEDFILKFVNDRVMDQKRLRGGVHFVLTFPLGLTGKVDRLKMRKMAQENYTKIVE